MNTNNHSLIEQDHSLLSPSPILFDLYLARIAYFESNPPVEGWNGVIRLLQT
jgi:hypothetical protein